MDLGLKGKVALVAASSRGLGKAIAWGLAKEGAKLVICARNKEDLEKTADDIFLATGVSIFPLAVDLSESDQIRWLIDETTDLFGRIDILVTNNGGPPPGNFKDVGEDDWMKAVQMTLMSAVRLTRAVLPGMRKQKWGRIIHMTSMTARQPIDGLLLSNVIRPGLLGLTRSMVKELATDNILVNAVCPGWIETERVQEIIKANAKKKKTSIDHETGQITDQIPMGRLGKPEEVSDLVVYLASERSSYITGSTILVDGGFVKGI